MGPAFFGQMRHERCNGPHEHAHAFGFCGVIIFMFFQGVDGFVNLRHRSVEAKIINTVGDFDRSFVNSPA